ncbi:uncharacterized protein [Rutidosis leptorrhynchoides]|uniref:uncharacterized protein n=1 Tax=Rutidosis leptorrhynchoides TaxID=125765 RepID=UPI003A99BA8C
MESALSKRKQTSKSKVNKENQATQSTSKRINRKPLGEIHLNQQNARVHLNNKYYAATSTQSKQLHPVYTNYGYIMNQPGSNCGKENLMPNMVLHTPRPSQYSCNCFQPMTPAIINPFNYYQTHHQSTPCNLLNNKCTTSIISPESQAKQDAKIKGANRIAILKQRKISQRTNRKNITPIPFDISEAGTSGVNKPIITRISKDYKDEGDMCHKCSACGALLWYKETRRGKNTKELQGSFSLCCLKGKISLPEFTKSPPKLLLDLYIKKHPKSKHFIENLRQYNLIFAFTSMGGKVDTSVNRGRGPWTFRIRGQNCHLLSGLVLSEGKTPKYSQLYIYDTTNKAANRKRGIGGKNQTQPTSSKNTLDEELIKELMEMLDECNPLVKMYQIARDRFEKNRKDNFKIKLIARRSTDGHNYNLPSIEEVAALVVGDILNDAPPASGYYARETVIEIIGILQLDQLELRARPGRRSSCYQDLVCVLASLMLYAYTCLIDIDLNFDKRHIVVHSLSEGLKRISELHLQYLALQYPQLFAYAEDGYRPDIDHQDVDDRSETTLAHMARKLHQQMLVDAYTMVESEQIHYIRNNPKIQRADTFANLTLATLSDDVINSMLGNCVKLPASFTGSARYMLENYRDAMELCRIYGYLDLFITFTCNSKWPEITRALEGTCFTLEDKPEYQARVFKMKLDCLMEDIKKNKIFGKVEPDLFTIEFQKCVLPHTHICIFLHESDKLPEPEDVDEYISAELPDKEEDPELYQLITELMIHGPRREDGRKVIKQGHELDYRNVVPYNEFLLRKNQAHINVEWCNQVGAIRYLFKYINKGNDRVIAGLCDEETDEIKEYYDWPTSYEDIGTIDGKMCSTFKNACFEMGLLDDDQEYINGIKDSDSLSHPEDVFEKTFDYLSVEIIPHRLSESEHSHLIDKLTEEQRDTYNTILNAVEKQIGGVLFLYRYGGTGKTFLWKTLSTALRSKGVIVLDVASSGIEALLLPGGRTAHSHFAIPIDPTDESVCTILPNSNLAGLTRRTKLIIWDKAPMVNCRGVEALDRSLRDICRTINPNSNETPFGGKVVVIGGDFRQVLPVITRGKREDIVVNMRLSNSSLNNSDEDNQDNLSDICKFADWLLDVSNGNVNPSEDGISKIEMPKDVLVKDIHDPIGSIINVIYPEFLDNLGNPTYYEQRAILAPTHEVVNIINDHMMQFLEGEERSYLNSDSICQSKRDSHFNRELYTTECLYSINIGGLQKHDLRLKVGVPVMLLRNIDHAGGFCNGTRLKIVELKDKVIKANILTGTHAYDYINWCS